MQFSSFRLSMSATTTCVHYTHAPQKHHTPDPVLSSQIPSHVRVYTDSQS